MPISRAATKTAGNLPVTAQRHDDQDRHEVLDREAGGKADHVDRQPAAQRRQAGADAEGHLEQPAGVDADSLGHGGIVDGSPQPGAEIRAIQDEDQRRRSWRHAYQDDEKAIAREAAAQQGQTVPDRNSGNGMV